jgi:hypothetical protein
VSLVFLLGFLGIYRTWIPFLFLICFSTWGYSIWVSNDTNSTATILGLAFLLLLCLLVLNLGVLSSCIEVGICLSSKCSGDDWIVGMACFYSFLIYFLTYTLPLSLSLCFDVEKLNYLQRISSLCGVMNLDFFDRVLPFLGRVFFMAHWVALDELPSSRETLYSWETRPVVLQVVD